MLTIFWVKLSGKANPGSWVADPEKYFKYQLAPAI
jgi:hypothetical protein